MATPAETVRGFYEKLRMGDAAGALGLLAPDIEWTTVWQQALGKGKRGQSKRYADMPLVAEWASFACLPTELIAQEDTVLSRGAFIGIHEPTGQRVQVRFTHLWIVKNGSITRFQQHFHTLTFAKEHRS